VQVNVNDGRGNGKARVTIEADLTVVELIESVAAYFDKKEGPYMLFNRRTQSWLMVGDDMQAAAARGYTYDTNAPIMGNQRAEQLLQNDDELDLYEDENG